MKSKTHATGQPMENVRALQCTLMLVTASLRVFLARPAPQVAYCPPSKYKLTIQVILGTHTAILPRVIANNRIQIIGKAILLGNNLKFSSTRQLRVVFVSCSGEPSLSAASDCFFPRQT